MANNILEDPNKPKLPKLQAPQVGANLTGAIPQFAPNATTPITGQAGKTATQIGTEALGAQLQGALTMSPQKKVQAERDIALRQQAGERQQLQDILGQTGQTGTMRELVAKRGLGETQQRTLTDITRKAQTEAEKSQQEALGGVVQGALGFGGLGVQEAGQTGQLALGAGELDIKRFSAESQDTLGRMDIASREKVAGMQIRSEADLATLNRDLQREIEAGRISQQEADRLSQEKMFEMDLTSRENQAAIERNWKGSQSNLDRALTAQVEAGKLAEAEASRISQERLTYAQITSQEKISSAQLASEENMVRLKIAHEEKLAADENYLKQQGIDLERAATFGYEDANGNHVMGELEMKGKEFGLESDRIDLMRTELLGTADTPGKLQIAADTLKEQIRANKVAESAAQWSKMYDMAEILSEENPQQAATIIKSLTADMTDASGNPINLPQIATQQQETSYLNNAGGDWDKASEAALADGVILSSPPVGKSSAKPITITAEDSPGSDLNGKGYMPSYDGIAGEQPLAEGQYVKFENNMKSDLGFAVPAGDYKVETIDITTFDPNNRAEGTKSVMVYTNTQTGEKYPALAIGGAGSNPQRTFTEAGLAQSFINLF